MLLETVYWDKAYTPIVLFSLALVVVIFTSLRVFSRFVSHIGNDGKTLQDGNIAYGISFSGLIFAISIILSGTIYGDIGFTIKDSLITIGLFGITGIALLSLTRLIFDKIAFKGISIKDEIQQGNIAAAIIDTCNLVATALVIRAVMVWITDNSKESLIALLLGYLISQIILTMTTFIRIKKFSRCNDTSLDQLFRRENIALALRFGGRKISTAFAITAASQIMVFEIYDVYHLFLGWFIVSVIFVFLVSLLSFIASKIIFFGVDIEEEIVKGNNKAIGAAHASIYICLAFLIAGLIA